MRQYSTVYNRRAAGSVVQNLCKFLTGNILIRAEGAVAVTSDNASLCCPLDCIIEPKILVGDIGKCRCSILVKGLVAGAIVHGLHNHCAVKTNFRCKSVGRNTDHNIMVIYVLHTRCVPSSCRYILKYHRYRRLQGSFLILCISPRRIRCKCSNRKHCCHTSR